jgi:hypothetical protein
MNCGTDYAGPTDSSSNRVLTIYAVNFGGVGNLNLRWSTGCMTAWSRVYNISQSVRHYCVQITSNHGYAYNNTTKLPPSTDIPGGGVTYSLMVYDGAGYTAWARGTTYNTTTKTCDTPWAVTNSY